MRRFIRRALERADMLGASQMQNLLRQSSKEIDRLETVMDSLVRGILVCDISHNLILANKAVRRFLPVISYEQGKEKIWTLIAEETVAEFLRQTLLSSDKAEEREFDVEAGGTRRLLGVSVMPVVQDRQVSGSLILVDDITERRNREARMRRMENLASLTTLAAGVAHEIKNPLGSLSIHVQLIQKTLDANKKRFNEARDREDAGGGDWQENFFPVVDKYLGVVNEEVERLNGIVMDFLFAVRPMNAEFRRGDINELVRELADFVSLELGEANIEIVLNLAEDMPALDFDGGLLKQALLNLIKNGAAAMGKGGKLTIVTENTEGEILISVADEGVGIPEENLAKIFEPYFTTKETGSGLGLTLVFKIVKEHQGEIGVRSKEGEGTVFTISLPKPQTEQRLISYTGEDASLRGEPETVRAEPE